MWFNGGVSLLTVWGSVVYEAGLPREEGCFALPQDVELVREEAALSARAACALAADNELILLAHLRLRMKNPHGAIMAVLPLLARNPPHPQALFIRGMVRLQKANPQGVHDLLSAAGAAPMLMGRAVAHVEAWLSGPGRAHDSIDFRDSLAALRKLHDRARAERMTLAGPLVLKRSSLSAAEEGMLRARLMPLARSLRVAWLAERVCDKLPRWRHHELLLEIPLPAHWPLKGLRQRLEFLRKAAQAAIPEGLDGTIGVRVFSALGQRRFRRQMRMAAGIPFLMGAEEEPAASKPGGAQLSET